MQLTKRMSTIASMVTTGNVVADIGTDHGYIPIYLVENKIIPGAVAMDINKGPLDRAKTHVEEHLLGDYIKLIQSNGLEKFEQGMATSIIIAGMGGMLIVEILKKGLEKLDGVKELILQPQSDIECVRRFLQDTGFKIVDEKALIDDGKYYFPMKAVWGIGDYETTTEFRYGKRLLESKDTVLFKYLEKERNKYLGIRESLDHMSTEKSEQRLTEIEDILAQNELARNYWR